MNDTDSKCRSTDDSASTYGGGFQPPESAVIQIGQADQGDCDGSAWFVAAQFGSLHDERGGQEISVELSVQFEPLLHEESPYWYEGDVGHTEKPGT